MFSEFSSESRVLISSEGGVSIEDIIAVNVDSTSSDTIGNLESIVNTFGDYSSTKSILRVVGSLNDFIDVLELHYGHNWSKDFLLCDGHIVSHITENCWFNKESLSSVSLSTCMQLGTFFLSNINIFQNLSHLFLIHLRTLIGIVSKWITNLSFTCSFS